MRILTFSTLYPNAEQSRHGIFVETRLQHLREHYAVDGDVMAPVPWFPLPQERFGRYGAYARVPSRETRNGIEVLHPRYLVVPGITWRIAPQLMFRSVLASARQAHEARRYDLIDAHYCFPDGVAAVMLGQALGLPVTITARGSDITVIPGYAGPRRRILWAAHNAARMITVCRALSEELVQLGADADSITVLRNGVDLERFVPGPRDTVRTHYAVGGRRLLLSVGNLIELKGHHLTIEALRDLPDTVLILVGSGPERGRLGALASRLGVAERVHFAGTVPQAELRHYYSAADAMVLASRSEGWANVLLEAMACGCPAVASRVWGTPEVVGAPEAGVLMEERTPRALAAAVSALFNAYPGREQTRAYAEQFDWLATSRGQYEIFTGICRGEITSPAARNGAS